MSKLLRTTITIPEEVYKKARITAATEGKSVSAFITDSIRLILSIPKKKSSIKDPLKILGTFSFDMSEESVKNIRKNAYEDHLKRKMGY